MHEAFEMLSPKVCISIKIICAILGPAEYPALQPMLASVPASLMVQAHHLQVKV